MTERLVYIFFIMFTLHVIADFNVQGMLGDLKQKEWWKKNYPDKMYHKDWFTCLMIHSIVWSVFITAPVVLMYSRFNIVNFIANVFCHMQVDHYKANKRILSLTADQFLHVVQIIFTIAIYEVLYGGA